MDFTSTIHCWLLSVIIGICCITSSKSVPCPGGSVLECFECSDSSSEASCRNKGSYVPCTGAGATCVTTSKISIKNNDLKKVSKECGVNSQCTPPECVDISSKEKICTTCAFDRCSAVSTFIPSTVQPTTVVSTEQSTFVSTLVYTTEPETTPQVTTQLETTPQVTTQLETTLQVTTQLETTPQVTTQLETTPQVTTQLETTPQVTTQLETTPQVTTQLETTPQESTILQQKLEATTQSETTPQITTHLQTTFEGTTQPETTTRAITPPDSTLQGTTKSASTAQETTELESTIQIRITTEGITTIKDATTSRFITTQSPIFTETSSIGETTIYTTKDATTFRYTTQSPISTAITSVECPPGNFLNGTICLECKIGFYQPDAGASECIPCDPEYTTNSTGTVDSIDCISPEIVQVVVNILLNWTDDYTNPESQAYRELLPLLQENFKALFERIPSFTGEYRIVSITRKRVGEQALNVIRETTVEAPAQAIQLPGNLGDTIEVLVEAVLVTNNLTTSNNTKEVEAIVKEAILSGDIDDNAELPTLPSDATSIAIVSNPKKCSPGFILDLITKVCSACNIGFYQPFSDSALCLPCPNEKTTRQPASTNVTNCLLVCPAGFSPSNNNNGTNEVCVACGLGFYQPNSDSKECIACPFGTTTAEQGTTNGSFCQGCPTGYFLNVSINVCQICDKGFYQPSSGAMQCVVCPDGYTTLQLGSTSIKQCVGTKDCYFGPYKCGSFASCLVLGSFAQCVCLSGYIGDGITCTDICQSGYCKNGGTCFRPNQFSEPQCSCMPSFSGIECENAVGKKDTTSSMDSTNIPIIFFAVAIIGFAIGLASYIMCSGGLKSKNKVLYNPLQYNRFHPPCNRHHPQYTRLRPQYTRLRPQCSSLRPQYTRLGRFQQPFSSLRYSNTPYYRGMSSLLNRPTSNYRVYTI